MKFEYYVLNYDFNRQKVEMFNVFDNISVQKDVEKTVRKYLRAPSKFKSEKHITYMIHETLYGFDAFCNEIRRTLMWQEWGRREYEISVGDAFEDDLDKFEKWDCYMQCEPNIPIIAREVIWQYKQQLKENETK